jgi:hypothetical protein
LNALGGSTSFTPADAAIMDQAGRDLDNDQSAEHQYMHAMRNLDRNQTPEDAREMANYYIRDRLNDAHALVAAGDRSAGMYQLGLALHTIQDSTSPSHFGFQGWSQKWTNDEWRSGNALNHVRQELRYPGNNSALFRATLTTMRMFEQGYGPGANAFIFGHD